MLPNDPVYVLLDIGVLWNALKLPNFVTDDARKYADISAVHPENALL